MRKATHSPLPWNRAEKSRVLTVDLGDNRIEQVVIVGQLTPSWYKGRPYSHEIMEENADFVWRAVNNHYALIEACQRAADFFRNFYPDEIKDKTSVEYLVYQACVQAIAKAKKGGAA